MEVAAIALKLTGMDLVVTRFQAFSALTGTGFPTSETETILEAPVRRKIVMTLMAIGHVGLAVIVLSLFGTISNRIAWWHLLLVAILVIHAPPWQRMFVGGRYPAFVRTGG